MTDPEILRYTQQTGDFSRMLNSIPYATWIGLQCERFGDDLRERVEQTQDARSGILMWSMTYLYFKGTPRAAQMLS